MDAQGRVTRKSVDALKSAVKKAAAASKKAFGSKDIFQALQQRYFPSPIKGKAKNADDLLAVTPAFAQWVSMRIKQGLPALPPEEWAPFFYIANNLKLDTSGGPLQLELRYKEVPCSEFVRTPRQAATQVALSEHTPSSDLRALLLRHVAEYALDPPKDKIWSIALTMDAESLTGAELPDRYLKNMACYADEFEEEFSNMEYVVAERRKEKSGAR